MQKNQKIIIIESEELKDINVLRNNLIHFYDIFNEAVNKLDIPKEEKEKYFLTNEQIEQMKKVENINLYKLTNAKININYEMRCT